MNIRIASPLDAEKILDIYKYYIENTAITFEYEIPCVEEFKGRIEGTLKKYPYLVAEEDGRIIAYVYASQFHSRRAYIYGAELSIYVDKDYRGKGIGKIMYDEIIKLLIKQNVITAYACIAMTDNEDDPHLTNASVHFHEKEGFIISGKHLRSGRKFDKWYDVVWMEKVINDAYDNPEEFIPFPEL